MMALNSDLFRPQQILDSFRINGIRATREEMVQREREEEFYESIELTPDQEEFLERMKKE